MLIWLTPSQAQTIVRHAVAEAPREACGFIAGIGSRAQRIVPLANVAADPYHYYEIDPATLVETLVEIEDAGLSLIGIYHSHPEGAPLLSQTDVRQAFYPDAAYLIVGLKPRPQLSAWSVQTDRVDRVDVYIGSDPPENIDESSLSRAQKIAIVLSALLAAVVMLALSLALLPPPPPLPAIIH